MGVTWDDDERRMRKPRHEDKEIILRVRRLLRNDGIILSI